MSIVNHNFDAVITAADVRNDFTPSAVTQPVGHRRRHRRQERERAGIVLSAPANLPAKLDPRTMAKPAKVEVG